MTDPKFRSDFTVEVIDSMGSDATPVEAARVSTKGAAARGAVADARFINRLLVDGHHSPFEHQVVTFRVEAPIFVTRQIARHRLASYNEESGRYKEMDGVFYIPSRERATKQVGKTMDYQFEDDYATNTIARDGIMSATIIAWDEYTYMLEAGVAKEVARMALPVNLYSNIWITMNSRALFNFFTLRSSYGEGHPQYEIREVADQMLTLWAGLFPETAAARMRLEAEQ